MAIIAVLVIAFVTSYIFCGTEQNNAGVDSIKIEEYTQFWEKEPAWIPLLEHIMVYYRLILRQHSR